MKRLLPVLLAAAVASCSPGKYYLFTHYHLTAEFDPGSGFLSASVHMVFPAKMNYADSIVFLLDPSLEVHTLAAQDLDHYLYTRSDTGRIVIYLEDPLASGDQFHISLHYSGYIKGAELDSSLLWIPVNRDTKPFTIEAKLVLPGSWKVLHPETLPGRRDEWLISFNDPVNSVQVLMVQEKQGESNE